LNSEIKAEWTEVMLGLSCVDYFCFEVDQSELLSFLLLHLVCFKRLLH